MKIGIELRTIVKGECGGIVPLLQGVLEAVFAGHPEHRIVLFCTEKNAELFPSPPPHVERLVFPHEESYFGLLDHAAAERGLDVLLRSYPWPASLQFPWSRQVALIPDLQHDYFPEFFAPEILILRRAAFQTILGHAAAIGTLTQHSRQTILEHPANRCQDVFLMGPALKVEKAVGSEAELTDEERAAFPAGNFFFYPGNLWPHKNHRRVLQAFDLFLRRTNEPFELIFTGHPAGWQELAAEFPNLPVRHLGFVRRPMLQLLLQRARALVFFSLFEGFGIPVLEAFHAGTPVVCSNTSSLPEVGGDAVLSCDPTHPQAMSELLLTITRDEGLRARLVARGKERVSLFSWQTSARNFIEACQRVIVRDEILRTTPTARLRARVEQGPGSPVPILRQIGHRLRERLHPYYHPYTAELTQRLHLTLLPKLGNNCQHPPVPFVVPPHYRRTLPPRPAPLISIVTPSYNQAVFLDRTIRSVLGQKYPALEYIVQDGGSTDGTVEVLDRYRYALKHCESVRDRGQAHAINQGFTHATGDILAYLNSDDVLLPGALAYVARFFARHPEVDVVYGHRVIIDENDQEVGRWILPPHDDQVLTWEDYVPQETLFWRRGIWEQVGSALDENFQFALDWDLLLRFAAAGARFVRLPRFLGAFRVHRQQKTNSNIVHVGYPEVRRLRERSHGRTVSVAEVQHRVQHYLRQHVVYHKLYRLGLLAG